MAKITELPATSTVAATDLLAVVTNVATTPTTKKISFTDLNATTVAAATATSAQRASNLSDLASVVTARTNLGLGTAATTAATAYETAGAGAAAVATSAQRASNLSDLASVITARTNLGLGGAATLAVGTTTGTVAAGDDVRIIGANQSVATVAALRALGASARYGVIALQGYYAAGDGGGGQFRWDPASTAADDAGITFLPTGLATAGRWVRLGDLAAVNVRWFGAKGDGTADDYASIVGSITATPTGGQTVFPGGGTFATGTTIGLVSGKNVAGTGTIKALVSLQMTVGGTNYTDIRIQDVTVDVNKAAYAATTITYATQNGIYIVATGAADLSGVVLENVKVINCHQAGIRLLHTTTTTSIKAIVRNSKASACSTGLMVHGGCVVIGGRYDSNSNCGVLIGYGVGGTLLGVTANGNSQHGLAVNYANAGAVVDGCTANGNTVYGIIVSDSCVEFTVTGNVCRGNGGAIGVDVVPVSLDAINAYGTVDNNIGTDSVTTHGLWVNGATGTIITGNIFLRNAIAGMGIAANGCIIKNNVAVGNLVGLDLYNSATHTSIVDGQHVIGSNRLSGNSTANYQAVSTLVVGTLLDNAIDSFSMVAGHETLCRTTPMGNNGYGSGRFMFGYFTARRAETVTKIATGTGSTAAGATPTLCRMGMYLEAANGDLTLVASTVNDTTLFAAANSRFEKAYSVPYTLIQGRRYAIGFIVVTAATVPSFKGIFPDQTIQGIGNLLSGGVVGFTDLPTTITAASISVGLGFHPYLDTRP